MTTRRRRGPSHAGAGREVAVPIARCPFTGAAAVMAIDVAGLDSPWWDYAAPLRGVEADDDLPPTVLCVTGALRYAEGHVEATDHLVMAGPEAPFVVPDLLADKRVKAVVSQVAIGPHIGYPITYFASLPVPHDLARTNTWGMDRCWYEGRSGEPVWFQRDDGSEAVAELDFALGPWLERGDLQWIAPGNADLTLRTGAAGCPYVDLPGRRAPVFANYGETWTLLTAPGAETLKSGY